MLGNITISLAFLKNNKQKENKFGIFMSQKRLKQKPFPLLFHVFVSTLVY